MAYDSPRAIGTGLFYPGPGSAGIAVDGVEVARFGANGMRLRSLTTAQRDAITSQVAGDTIYNGTTDETNVYNGTAWVTPGSDAEVAAVVAGATFTQAGIGAIARLVTDRLKDVVSVKDFGAVGNGSTDDTAAFQAAAAAMGVLGAGEITLPRGNYLLTGTVVLTSHNIHIRGAGKLATLITFNPATAIPCFKFSLAGTGTADITRCGIRGIGFYGLAGVNAIAKTGVLVESASDFLAADLAFTLWSSGRAIAGSITATETTLHVTTGTMASGDVGKTVQIVGAGASGAILSTTIASFTNSTTVELTVAASTTVTTKAGVVLPVGYAPSTGLRFQGHELITVRDCSIAADRPIWIQGDKKASGIDFDHCRIENTPLSPLVPSESCIEVDSLDLAGGTSLFMADLVIDGAAWALGSHGFHWAGGSIAVKSLHLGFANIRREQSQDPAGHTVYIDHNVSNVVLYKVRADDANARGFLFKHCDYVSLINPLYVGTSYGVVADATTELAWFGAYWGASTLFSMNAMHTKYQSAATIAGSSAACYVLDTDTTSYVFSAISTSGLATLANAYVPGVAIIGGDVDAGGGFRQTIDGWYQDDVTASQAAVALARLAAGALPAAWIAPRAGSVTAISVKSNAARTAGTLTVEIFKDGTGIGLTAVLDGTNTTVKTTTQAKDMDAFAVGDELDVRITTDSAWLPTTADIRVAIEVET